MRATATVVLFAWAQFAAGSNVCPSPEAAAIAYQEATSDEDRSDRPDRVSDDAALLGTELVGRDVSLVQRSYLKDELVKHFFLDSFLDR
jgi:hypothetical protein